MLAESALLIGGDFTDGAVMVAARLLRGPRLSAGDRLARRFAAHPELPGAAGTDAGPLADLAHAPSDRSGTHRAVFTWVPQQLADAGLVKGTTIGIDATTLEANAALRSHRHDYLRHGLLVS